MCTDNQNCNGYLVSRIDVQGFDALEAVGTSTFSASIPVADLTSPNSPLKMFCEGTRLGQTAIYLIQRDNGEQSFTFTSAGVVKPVPLDGFDKPAIKLFGPHRPSTK